MQEIIDGFADTIRTAAGNNASLCIRGGGTKDFYGDRRIAFADSRIPDNDKAGSGVLDSTAYSGFVDYEPTELVVTARSGTRLTDLETELNKHGQMLAFEPPRFGVGATLGGSVSVAHGASEPGAETFDVEIGGFVAEHPNEGVVGVVGLFRCCQDVGERLAHVVEVGDAVLAHVGEEARGGEAPTERERRT